MTASGLVQDRLEKLVLQYESPDFIQTDPISIPHEYHLLADIEISGLFAAIFSWGNRKTIINKSRELMIMMDHAPYQFMMGHTAHDLKKLQSAKEQVESVVASNQEFAIAANNLIVNTESLLSKIEVATEGTIGQFSQKLERGFGGWRTLADADISPCIRCCDGGCIGNTLWNAA